ncbi:MAG: hypothetical protein JNK38_09125 [Acidobacteria bacterium]|nr:hypothetical protein [Acidobacteriota bacterium]
MAETLTVSVLRLDDLLVLKFEFINLVRKEIVDPQLGRSKKKHYAGSKSAKNWQDIS